MERNSPSESLGRLLEQFRGGAAENEKTDSPRPMIRQDAEHGKEIGATLNLVDNHQSTQIGQRQAGIIEPSEIGRILQVESLRRFTFQLENLLGKRRLSDLSGAENSDDRELLQQRT